MNLAGCLFCAVVVFGFAVAGFSTGLILLGDYLHDHAPGSAARDDADRRAVRLGVRLAAALAGLFVLRWWLG